MINNQNQQKIFTNKNNKKNSKAPQIRMNEQLYGNHIVRVIYPGEEHIENKEMELSDAKILAQELGLDIFEISPHVLKIDDYKKWLYDTKKKEKAHKQKVSELKEIQLSVNIGKNDLQIKAKKAMEFIEDGDKVKVVLTLKRRELERLDESKRCLYEFILLVQDVAVPESLPKETGNKSIVILKKKKMK